MSEKARIRYGIYDKRVAFRHLTQMELKCVYRIQKEDVFGIQYLSIEVIV